MRPDPAQREEARAIARELAQIARTAAVLPGSIGERRTRCGQPSCACQTDPSRRHGPYWHWTRKVAGKTAGRYVSEGAAAEYRSWIDNDRRLRELLARLEAIGIERLEAARRDD